MSAPPAALTITMTPADVHDNLVRTVASMDRIRRETMNNLGATDEQILARAQEYLRLTEELASCVKAVIEDNPVVERQYRAIAALWERDPLLQRFDPLQAAFWARRETRLQPAAVDAAVVLLKEDFTGEEQAYHLFQAMKYLGINGDREGVYETILPVNSLLHDGTLSSPDVSRFLIKQLFGTQRGIGVHADVDAEVLVESLREIGALYVDLPEEQFAAMKKKHSRTQMVEEGKEKRTRVIFELNDGERFIDVSEQLEAYAVLDLGPAENDLVKRVPRFFAFGKQFLEEMANAIGIRQPPDDLKEKKNLAAVVGALDDAVIAKGTETQDGWNSYYAETVTDGRVMAAAPDIYHAVKQWMNDGADGERKLKGLRKDCTGGNWLVMSTRLQHNINPEDSLEGRIVHHYGCNRPELIQESLPLKIPEYRGTLIAAVAGSDEGLHYLQTYFDNDDDAETILQTVELLSGVSRGSIKVWTATLDSRPSNPDRAAFLVDRVDAFHIIGDGLNFSGCSRGVRYI